MLDLQRRRFVRDRTQAIQRLRPDWTQHDPVAEAGTLRCDRQRELRKPWRIDLGDSLAQRTAARCIRELASDIDDLNHRIHALDTEIARPPGRLRQPARGPPRRWQQPHRTIIAQAGDVRRVRDARAFARFCGAAPIPAGSGHTSGRHRLHRGGSRQLNAALYRIAIVQQRPTPFMDDIGESNDSSAPCSAAGLRRDLPLAALDGWLWHDKEKPDCRGPPAELHEGSSERVAASWRISGRGRKAALKGSPLTATAAMSDALMVPAGVGSARESRVAVSADGRDDLIATRRVLSAARRRRACRRSR